MQFHESETIKNLARSFAGESQAGMRYQLIVKQATSLGYLALANVVRTIAKNETFHAKRFFELLVKYGGSVENIQIDAGYPFHTGSLEESLAFAAKDEREEQEKIYPKFAEIAQKEGFSEIARAFELVANVEKQHEKVFLYLEKAYREGTLYTSDEETVWVCGDCGYIHKGKQAWNVCPLCGASQGEVLLHLPEGDA